MRAAAYRRKTGKILCRTVLARIDSGRRLPVEWPGFGSGPAGAEVGVQLRAMPAPRPRALLDVFGAARDAGGVERPEVLEKVGP
jgi:hypothetical protein